jgi:hypothetical protein
MSAQATMRVSIALLIGLSFAACSDDDPATSPQNDGGPQTIDSGTSNEAGSGFDAGVGLDAARDAGNNADTGNEFTDAASASCTALESPGLLPRPPTGALPCELLPPGFSR